MQTPEGLMRTIIGYCEEVADYQGDGWCRTHTNTLVDGICPKADATLDLIRERDAAVAAKAWDEGFTSGFYTGTSPRWGEGADASEPDVTNPYEREAGESDADA